MNQLPLQWHQEWQQSLKVLFLPQTIDTLRLTVERHLDCCLEQKQSGSGKHLLRKVDLPTHL